MHHSQPPFQSITFGFTLIVGVTLAAAIVLMPVAGLAIGDRGVISVVVSMVTCLIPAIAILGLSVLDIFRAPLVCLLASTFLRMGMALTVVLIANWKFPELKFQDFYAWLVVFYCVTLAAETYFLSRPQKSLPKAQS